MQELSERKPNRKPVYMRLPGKLRDLLEKTARENRRSMTTEVVIALEKHLGVEASNGSNS